MSQRKETVELLKQHAAKLLSGEAALPENLFLFSGPCQLESKEHALTLAQKIKEIAEQNGFRYVFKASFDKANRTRVDSKRGIGLEDALPIFTEIQEQLDIPTLTDIHLPSHPEELGDAIDVLQIPAFLCRQTDLLVSAGATGKVVNVKKGQFAHPHDMRHAAEKILSANKEASVYLCERGTSFGYRDLVVDMRGLVQMRELQYPIVFDGSHVVQAMSAKDGVSGGDSSLTPPLCRGAVAVGVDGVFIETHETPRSAPSDADSMLPLEELPSLLSELRDLHNIVSQRKS